MASAMNDTSITIKRRRRYRNRNPYVRPQRYKAGHNTDLPCRFYKRNKSDRSSDPPEP